MDTRRAKIGPIFKKILILLGGGLAIGLSGRPDQAFKILDSMIKEWQWISQQELRRAIKRLYKAKLIHSIDNADGTTTLALSDDGKKRTLEFNLEKLELKKQKTWDKQWRIVIFDIPETHKKARDAFARKLIELGFKSIQRSVLVYPHDCTEELEFMIEIFEIRPFVRTIVAKEIDIDSELRNKFRLS